MLRIRNHLARDLLKPQQNPSHTKRLFTETSSLNKFVMELSNLIITFRNKWPGLIFFFSLRLAAEKIISFCCLKKKQVYTRDSLTIWIRKELLCINDYNKCQKQKHMYFLHQSGVCWQQNEMMELAQEPFERRGNLNLIPLPGQAQ